MQNTSGIYSVLNSPWIYRLVQFLFTHKETSQKLAAELQVLESDVVYDIGCGPGTTRELLGDCKYYGFDVSATYIAQAQERFADQPNTQFFCSLFDSDSTGSLPPANLVIMVGVMHHLDDDELQAIFSLIATKLAPGGKFVSLDPSFVDKQNAIAKALVSRDRGKNVRSSKEYLALVEPALTVLSNEVIHQNLPPYDRVLISAGRSDTTNGPAE